MGPDVAGPEHNPQALKSSPSQGLVFVTLSLHSLSQHWLLYLLFIFTIAAEKSRVLHLSCKRVQNLRETLRIILTIRNFQVKNWFSLKCDVLVD